jgi:hypothetical protein
MKSSEVGGKLDYVNFGHTQRYYQIRSKEFLLLEYMLVLVYVQQNIHKSQEIFDLRKFILKLPL